MPAERAGFTVTMFLVDVSPSMGKSRTITQPPGPDGEERHTEVTSLEWALHFVKMKIQDMIFGGRKTEQCGVITFGSEGTKNIINEKNGDYDNVYEYIEIAQPNSGTIAKLDGLRPSTVAGDPLDALIVGIETQAEYLAKKKTWTRKVILVTDGESPIQMEHWQAVVGKMNALDISLAIVGVDFDDPEYPYQEPDKPVIKTTNEQFYHTLVSSLHNGVVGTCAYALQEITRPDIRIVKSTLMGTVLRLGDVDTYPSEAIEINVKTSKCTAVSRPKSWKKFATRNNTAKMEVDGDEGKAEFAQLRMRTEYYVNRDGGHAGDDGGIKLEGGEDLLDSGAMSNEQNPRSDQLEKVEKEELVRGFKYGTTYVPCPDGQFPKLPTRKAIELCGFFPANNFRRDYSMGEISYVWADPASPQQQAALSSIVQAMYQKNSMAIARLVTRDGMDPKMGVLRPTVFDKVDCFLWVQVPFADDVRKYSFASLERLVSKKREVLTSHPYLPTEEQQTAMDSFVDAMDLMDAGDKGEEGNRQPWFDTRFSYNPSLHRVKQALSHCATVSDLKKQPLPPPHPELLKFFNTPRRVIKRATNTIGECKGIFKVKEVPKKSSTKARRYEHAHAEEEDDGDLLLLDQSQMPRRNQSMLKQPVSPSLNKSKTKIIAPDDSATEEEDDLVHISKDSHLSLDKLGLYQHYENAAHLLTPARSMSPQASHGRVEGKNRYVEVDTDDLDPGREHGRIIGTTNPLKDFHKNLKRGDVVTKAVEDMGFVIGQIILRPFAWRRTDELKECLKEMRDVAVKEDEIDSWNTFMEDFKKKCLSKPGNQEFWQEIRKTGQELGLISELEAGQYGGTSAVTEREAAEFFT